jgi:CRP/FNR family transcriptional regulator, cyclic AMP receptor protein
MAAQSKRDVLADSPLFKNLLPDELAMIVDLVVDREYRGGEVIFNEGAPGDAVFVIAQGEVDILASSPMGLMHLATLRAPAFFGEMSLIDKEYRSATARAHVDSRLLQLTNESLHAFAKSHRNGFTWVVVNIARALSARLRDANRRLMERG